MDPNPSDQTDLSRSSRPQRLLDPSLRGHTQTSTVVTPGRTSSPSLSPTPPSIVSVLSGSQSLFRYDSP